MYTYIVLAAPCENVWSYGRLVCMCAEMPLNSVIIKYLLVEQLIRTHFGTECTNNNKKNLCIHINR